jgi:hypothetical protein
MNMKKKNQLQRPFNMVVTRNRVALISEARHVLITA